MESKTSLNCTDKNIIKSPSRTYHDQEALCDRESIQSHHYNDCLSNKFLLPMTVLSLHLLILQGGPQVLSSALFHQHFPHALYTHNDGGTKHRLLLPSLKQAILVHVLIRKIPWKPLSFNQVYLFFFSQHSTSPQIHPGLTSLCLKPSLSVSTGLWTFLQCLQMEQNIPGYARWTPSG